VGSETYVQPDSIQSKERELYGWNLRMDRLRDAQLPRTPMEKLIKDLRFAIRTLLRAPGFSIVVVISIALGFAANVTVFSIANGLLWGVLPVKDPGRMVMFSEGESFSYPDYIDYQAQTGTVFEGGIPAHFPLIPASIGGKGEPERTWGQA
jgi:hypothetical protein